MSCKHRLVVYYSILTVCFVQLLHWCFSHWYTLVVESRAKLGKATAIGDWKLQLRAWQAWRTFVSGRRARKERDRLARELQRERT